MSKTSVRIGAFEIDDAVLHAEQFGEFVDQGADAGEDAVRA